MTNTRIILLSLIMIIFTALLIFAYTAYSTGIVTVYGEEYVSRYFQRDKVMEINIEISEADWDYMMENPMEEEFRMATVTVNGDVYPLVKIRTKGNSSLMSVARSDSDRYSFKINFQYHKRNSQTMVGLTQLNLNNGFSDPSYMREYLSYKIFGEMGVAVPAFAFAAVYVNGEYYGLYLAVESVLEPYLERNFGDITGDLYKSEGNTLKYNGTNPAGYTGLEVKSTRKNADWPRLIRMLDALNNDGDIEKYLDVDAALRYIAVSTALANFDSYQGNFGHNYYLYEQNGVFTILPWDLNMSFGGFSFGGNASSVYIDEPTQGALAERPLIAKLLGNEEYLKTYHGYLEQIATQFLSGGYLEGETAKLFELISPYVRTDPTAFYTYEQFEQSISTTISGGAMGDENEVGAVSNQQRANNEPGRQGFRMGGVQGFGGNVPGILELASAMSESIQKQLSGELPSTNDGMGGGMSMGGGRMPNFAGGQPPDRDGGMMMPGEMPPGGMRRENPGGNIPFEMGLMGPGQPQLIDKTAFTFLLASGVAIIVGIIIVLFFKRRRYVKI